MAVKVILEGTLQGVDLSQPDNINIIWPLYRDPKVDIAFILEGIFKKQGMGYIPVIKEGAFDQSLLGFADEVPRNVPVVVVSRATDTAERHGIDELISYYIKTEQPEDGQPQYVDVTQDLINNIPDGAGLAFFGQGSSVNVTINIFCLNQQLIDQLYGFVKIALFAAERDFINSLGYIDILRTGGGDGDTVSMNIETQGGTRLLFHRTLTYTCRILDFVAGVGQLVNLIQSTYLGLESQPDGTAEQSVDLN
jgi:hypothetical protein